MEGRRVVASVDRLDQAASLAPLVSVILSPLNYKMERMIFCARGFLFSLLDSLVIFTLDT